jgi:hypothetical protein
LAVFHAKVFHAVVKCTWRLVALVFSVIKAIAFFHSTTVPIVSGFVLRNRGGLVNDEQGNQHKLQENN